MRDNVQCEFPAGYDDTAILNRLAQVLDPELDESIVQYRRTRSGSCRSHHRATGLGTPAARQSPWQGRQVEDLPVVARDGTGDRCDAAESPAISSAIKSSVLEHRGQAVDPPRPV